MVQRLLNHGVAVNIENAGKYYDVAIENLNHLDKLMNEYKSTTVSGRVATIIE